MVGDGGLSLSECRRVFEERQRRRRLWWVVGASVGVALAVWWGPAVRGAVERAVQGPAAEVSALDEFASVVEELQERLLATAVDGMGGVDFPLQQVAELQAVLDGARAGYVEGGADPGLVRVRQVVESSQEHLEGAAQWSARVGDEPGQEWARCQKKAGAPVGTREHMTEALRACLELLDMSRSQILPQKLGDVDDYLNSITGPYRSVYKYSFGVASGGR